MKKLTVFLRKLFTSYPFMLLLTFASLTLLGYMTYAVYQNAKHQVFRSPTAKELSMCPHYLGGFNSLVYLSKGECINVMSYRPTYKYTLNITRQWNNYIYIGSDANDKIFIAQHTLQQPGADVVYSVDTTANLAAFTIIGDTLYFAIDGKNKDIYYYDLPIKKYQQPTIMRGNYKNVTPQQVYSSSKLPYPMTSESLLRRLKLPLNYAITVEKTE